MFAIYNKAGLNFRSTIDNLYSLSNVDSISRVRNNTEEGLPKDHSLRKKTGKTFEEELNAKNGNKDTSDAATIYKEIASIDTKEPIFHIKDLMKTDVITLNEEDTIKKAFDLMNEYHIRQIPVLSVEDGKIIGMVTHKLLLEYIFNDLEYAEHNANRTLDTLEFGQVITADPITDIRRVAKVMSDFSLTAIPVVDEEDNIKGIVSRANILKAIANTPPLQIWG